jgi:hypothetical protein
MGLGVSSYPDTLTLPSLLERTVGTAIGEEGQGSKKCPKTFIAGAFKVCYMLLRNNSVSQELSSVNSATC